MAFTNEHHHLLWLDIILQPNLFNIALYIHGPWFYVHIIYSYLLLFIGTFWLLKGLLVFSRQKRKQIVIIVSGVIIGWTSNILYVLGLFPVTGLDITPLSFTFIAIVLSWNTFQFRLFDILPIARDLLLENMVDGVLVLDPQDTIIDINPAALAILKHKKIHSPMGHSIRNVFDHESPILHELDNKNDFQSELCLSEKPLQYVNFSVSSIYDQSHNFIGKVLIFHDITKRKLIEIKEQEQRELAEALADTAAVINSTLNLDEVLENILTNVGRVVPHDTANIALIEINDMVRFVRTRGYEKYGTQDIVPQIKCKLSDIPNLKKMAETGQPCFNPDTDNDPEWSRDIPGSSWIKSYMGAPIIGKGRVHGFINLDAGTPNFFKEEYIPRLQVFANQAAVAIQNAQLFSEVAKSAEEMKILYEVSSEITERLNLEGVIKTLFDKLKIVTPIDLFNVAILNETEGIATFHMYQENEEQIALGPISVVDQPSFTRYVLEKGKLVYIPDSFDDNSEFPQMNIVKAPGHNERSILGIPLMLGKEKIGVLSLWAGRPNAYSDDQIRLVETIAHQASISISNAQMFEKIQSMAILDTLTGVYNRRYFYEYAENEIIRSQRYNNEMSLIMLDIDHFKLVNDRFGHLIGDETLKMIVNTCLSVLRKSDVLCRFGGEEFLVLLPETSQQDAVIAAQRICQTIAQQSLPTNSDLGPVTVTVSIGVTQLKSKEDSLQDLIDEADHALYEAKQSGRNRVCVFQRK
ncbi:eukaryotic-like serine/threonine-protein kinase [Pelolinea submarina]|nr:eukaryotic-like serine/threonine-protein kinase [Pelolinea submarina]